MVTTWEGDYATAQKLADAECKKAGRIAKLAVRLTNTETSFDCVN
ncbi:MAG TPA: hypothetical protein VD932_04750 [Aquabacterium sp.]|nr:hypothetical protein [Aquabacterium sp.]